jgi:hypothetical protein
MHAAFKSILSLSSPTFCLQPEIPFFLHSLIFLKANHLMASSSSSTPHSNLNLNLNLGL